VEASMLGVFVVAASLALFCFLIMRAVGALSVQYDRLTGSAPTVRQHLPWLRSMRGERPQYDQGPAPVLTAPERIFVLLVVLAVVAFEIWFFFFSTSPIDQRSGR
jgi:hypothetical protein